MSTAWVKTSVSYSLLAVIATVVVVHAQTGSPSDENAIREIVKHWEQAWERFDGQLLTNDYASDADFMDAFGNRQTGSTAIVNAMTRQLKAPQVQQRKTSWKPAVIRFVRPDVAIVYHDYETVGQQTPAGEPVPPRDTRSVRTLVKNSDEWRIVSHFIMDTRPSVARH